MAEYAIDFLSNEERYNLMIDEFSNIRNMLGDVGVSDKIASKILSDFKIL
mgnify:CR=1 FL=1